VTESVTVTVTEIVTESDPVNGAGEPCSPPR